jgi:cell division septation protein DedD
MCVETSLPISAASGNREALPDHEFINIPARQCVVRRTGLGERFVHYRGKDYLLVGLYLVPQLGERPELFFVLRSIYGGGPARTPLPSGRYRVRLRSITGLRLFPQGVLMAAIIALVAPVGNGPKSPGGAFRRTNIRQENSENSLTFAMISPPTMRARMIRRSTVHRPLWLRIAVAPLAGLLGLSTVLSLAQPGRSAPLSVGLIAKEFLFFPKDVTVGTGEIAFIVKNQGAIEHNLVLESLGGETVAQIAIIEPGETTRVTASLPAGIYTIYCSLPGHRDAGMAATLRVSPSFLSKPTSTAPSSPTPALQSPAFSPPGPTMTPSSPAPAPRSPVLSPPGPTLARPGVTEPAARPAAPSAALVGRPEFHVQAGAFRQRAYADELVKQLLAKGYTVTLVVGPLLRVWVGWAMSRAAAERLAANLRSNGFEALVKPVQ